MSLCVEKQWCGFASLKMFVFMWQKYDDFCFMWLKTMIYASFSFSAQDSMDEACAEGIGNEHYRLEGRSLPIFFLSVVKLVGVLFQLNGKKTLSQKHYLELNFRYLCGSLIQCFIPSSSAPHPFSKPQQCADEVPFTFPPAFSPSPSLIRPSPAVHCKVPPFPHVFSLMWCDPGLRALGGESLSLPFKDTIGREVQAKM